MELGLFYCIVALMLLLVTNLILFSSGFSLTHVDEVIDELLTNDYSCDIAMPRVKKRYSTDNLCGYVPVNLLFKGKLLMLFLNQGLRRIFIVYKREILGSQVLNVAVLFFLSLYVSRLSECSIF